MINSFPSGLSDVKYIKLIDFVTDNLFYKGEAAPTTTVSSSGWRLSKTVIGGDGDITETWANGSASFANTWDDRITYTYS
jgi:hypothetical protein